MRRRAFVAGACLAPFTARASSRASALAGDRFLLDDREMRLADVLAPDAARDPTSARFARDALAKLLDDEFDWVETGAPDRWDRPFAHVFVRADAPLRTSAQERLVSMGAVRVHPESADHAFIAALLRAEDVARNAKAGLWAQRRYAVRPADRASDAAGAFHVIEGTPVAAASGGGRVYLNFGEDYRRDFTASARSRLSKKWAKAGLDLAALVGRPLRLRGHVAWINGPSIDLAHPLQIEVLERETPAAEIGAPA